YRIALKARTMTAKRRAKEKQAAVMPESEATQHEDWRKLQPILDHELNRLPDVYRVPILLCDLEGKSIKEATRLLGWPQGTLCCRLARGRKMLAKRLTNRGVTLSGGLLAVLLSEKIALAGVPASLMSSTLKAASVIAAGQMCVVPAKV